MKEIKNGEEPMNFIRVTSPSHDMYKEAIALYKISFPSHEQREVQSQHRILECDKYHFDLIYDENRFAGIILYWETADFIYVEHFCIKPGLRGKRYGQRALELLKEKSKTIILEIDPPSDEVSVKRRSFYERSGYVANSFPHVHPPYHRGAEGHLLMIMSTPQLLSEQEYKDFNHFLKYDVMGN